MGCFNAIRSGRPDRWKDHEILKKQACPLPCWEDQCLLHHSMGVCHRTWVGPWGLPGVPLSHPVGTQHHPYMKWKTLIHSKLPTVELLCFHTRKAPSSPNSTVDSLVYIYIYISCASIISSISVVDRLHPLRLHPLRQGRRIGRSRPPAPRFERPGKSPDTASPQA